MGPDLGRHGVWSSVMQLAGVLRNHSPAMIEKMRERRLVRPRFTADELADLIAFLYDLNYFDPPGNADQGKRLFVQKACSACLSVGGDGGNLDSALDRYKRFASPLVLARTMWSHGPAMEQHIQILGLPWPRFQGNEVREHDHDFGPALAQAPAPVRPFQVAPRPIQWRRAESMVMQR